MITIKRYRTDIDMWETSYTIKGFAIFSKYELFSKKTKYTLFKKSKAVYWDCKPLKTLEFTLDELGLKNKWEFPINYNLK